MSTFNGKRLNMEIYGQSHSKTIGAKVSGFPKFVIDFTALQKFLDRRKATNSVFSTQRIEKDIPEFTNVNNGLIEGEFGFEIKNHNIKSDDYNPLYGKPRPSHADYAWFLKDGQLDFTGGGRFSGRMTAPLCVVGGICKQYLESKGIKICAYISQIGNVKGLSYKTELLSYDEIIQKTSGEFPSLTDKPKMLEEIQSAKQNGDSVGGKIECIVYGLQTIGDNLFGGLEGKISSLIYSVPAVKGVEFGSGFDFCSMRGSNANDQLEFKNGDIKFKSNNAGGINGGIANGQPITVGVAIRPTPSIATEQNTVDLVKRENTTIKIAGRHDACILPRAIPCIESAVAIALVDELGE